MELIKDNYFTDQVVYRIIPDFIAQYGIAADPDETDKWDDIPDDPPHSPPIPFKLGTLSFAGAGPNTRSSHVFFGAGDRVKGLGGAPHERPIGQIMNLAEVRACAAARLLPHATSACLRLRYAARHCLAAASPLPPLPHHCLNPGSGRTRRGRPR